MPFPANPLLPLSAAPHLRCTAPSRLASASGERSAETHSRLAGARIHHPTSDGQLVFQVEVRRALKAARMLEDSQVGDASEELCLALLGRPNARGVHTLPEDMPDVVRLVSAMKAGFESLWLDDHGAAQALASWETRVYSG